MATVRILYDLTPQGRKASILNGGNGQTIQIAEVGPDSPEFARAVSLATVDSDGTATITARGIVAYDWSVKYIAWDHIPSIPELLDEVVAALARKAASDAAKLEERRLKTLEVLQARQTRETRIDYELGVQYSVHKPDWPADPDKSVSESEEALAWIAELKIKNEAAQADADTRLAAAQAAAEAKKLAAAQREEARRIELGLRPGDTDYICEDGALIQVPCWESHSRGRNWFASISLNPSKPGGIARDFHAKGDSYYMLPQLAPGQPVEFGADYYSGSGRRSSRRWYGYVVRVDAETEAEPGRLVLHKTATPKAAVNEGQIYAASLVTV